MPESPHWKDSHYVTQRTLKPALEQPISTGPDSTAELAGFSSRALSERAANYLAQAKKAMARKDLDRVLAEDSN